MVMQGIHRHGAKYMLCCVQTSREHFETRTHQRIVDIKALTADTIDALMGLDLPAGVDVEVKL